MKMSYCNHDMEDYIDYHDIQYTYIAHHYCLTLVVYIDVQLLGI